MNFPEPHEIIARARVAEGISEAELSRRAMVGGGRKLTQPRINRWLSGQVRMPADAFLQLCIVLKVDLAAILGPGARPSGLGAPFDVACRNVIDELIAFEKIMTPTDGKTSADILLAYLRSNRSRLVEFKQRQDGPAQDTVKALKVVVQPIEAKPRNQRMGLPTLQIVEGRSSSGKVLPVFSGVAAGHGGDIEAVAKLCHLAEYPDATQLSLIRVSGDSMLDTIHPGQLVVVDNANFPASLSPLPRGKKKTSIMAVRGLVPDGSLVVVRVDDEASTIKEVKYGGFDGDWNLLLLAHNGQWATQNGYPKAITRSNKVTFEGRILGLAK